VNSRTLLRAVAIFIAAFILIPASEPKGPESCYDVRVVGTQLCARRTYCLIVKFPGTLAQRLVKMPVDRPFADDYIGPAALLIRRGMFTRSDNYRFRESCVVAHH
jgi:hypothetical protein